MGLIVDTSTLIQSERRGEAIEDLLRASVLLTAKPILAFRRSRLWN